MRNTILAAAAASTIFAAGASADHIWINEFHYDNPGADTGEFVEVAIRTPNGSGATATDYAVEFYNGSNGDLYNTTGTLDTFDMINAFPVAGSTDMITLYSMPVSGIQNGAPDGIALVNVTDSSVIQFLSYEGDFTADADNGGIAGAAGAMSTEVPASEPGTGNLTSLSAMGSGDDADDFDADSFMLTEVQTPGAVNTGQAFVVPEPTSLALLGLGGLAVLRRRRA